MTHDLLHDAIRLTKSAVALGVELGKRGCTTVASTVCRLKLHARRAHVSDIITHTAFILGVTI